MKPALCVWLVIAALSGLFLQTDSRLAPPAEPWPTFPWLAADRQYEALERRIQPPRGFHRLESQERSFASWLRALPVKPGQPEVRLYNGRRKPNQSAHYAVLDIDAGNRDLQQCADAVIRLRAEYLRAVDCEGSIQFHFTSGDLVPWRRWRSGERPVVLRNRMSWRSGRAPDSSYPNFRKYLDQIFIYAGSASLARELVAVSDPARPVPGDMYVQGGSPGHAVLVADVCVNNRDERLFLLVQSYMPAQDIHILVNPESPGSPWYAAARTGRLMTPEWTFDYRDLRRFPADGCEPSSGSTVPPS